ncbi:MAG: thiamine phosphate synthase [Deltaproteobacteria bacterium]|nr:thiamine phosphate synthase [Deltaproteobacteria bacterium]
MAHALQARLRGLYAIADSGYRPEIPVLEKVRALLAGGAKVVQLRLKREGGREALALAREAVPLCRAHDALCIINDRTDVALLSGADGVHLGAEDLPVDEARRAAPKLLLGATVRDLAGAEAAAALGADYVGYGPVFGTKTKKLDVPPRGLEALADVAAKSPLPVIAIGGIDLPRIGEVAKAGASMAAVVGAALGAPEVPLAVRELSQAFASGASR